MRGHAERLNSLAKRLRVQANDLRFDNFLSFIYTSEIVNKYLDTELKKFGLNRTQMSILHILIVRGGTLTPTDLSHRITRSKHATTKAVDSLENLGLTKSARTKLDRRLRRVTITEKGLDQVEQTMSLRRTIGSQAMQFLDQENAEAFQAILRRFREHVIQLTGKSQDSL
ncbi:MAG TPA: MarR family transcriptional regulator [Dehalococcoidales bacterium]|nr:MarR family transcriptional regulator [Dehalococcoidales bacterium]